MDPMSLQFLISSSPSGERQPDDIAGPPIEEAVNPTSPEQSVPEAGTSSATNHADETTGIDRALFSCQSCNSTFSAERSLHRHNALRHSNKTFFKCSVPKCGATFTQRTYMDRHINIAHPRVPVTRSIKHRASIVGKIASSPQEREEKNIRMPGLLCTAPFCLKKFRDQSALRRHTNGVHTKQTAYVCKICSSIFYFNYNLKRHMRVVHKEVE